MRTPFYLLVVTLMLGLWMLGVARVSAHPVDPECTANTTSLVEHELAVATGIDLTSGVTSAVSDTAGLAMPVPESSLAMPMPQSNPCTAVDGFITAGLLPDPAVSDSDIYLLTGVPATPFQLTLHHHPAATFRLVVADAMTGAFITNCSSLLDQCLVQTTSSSVSISVSAVNRGVYTLSVYNGSALTPPAAVASVGCMEQFIDVGRFILCEQTATVCSFNTSKAINEIDFTCAERCSGAAPTSTCLGAYETSSDSCSPITVEDCTTRSVQTKICLCHRSS